MSGTQFCFYENDIVNRFQVESCKNSFGLSHSRYFESGAMAIHREEIEDQHWWKIVPELKDGKEQITTVSCLLNSK